MASNSQNKLLPVGALLFSSTMWGVIWYPLRLLEQQGLFGLWTSLIMFLAASIVTLPWLRFRRVDMEGQWGLLAILMLASGWANIAFILAVIDGNVVRVLLLFFLSPLWAVLLGRIVLGEKLDKMGAVTLILALSGAGFMLWRPESGLPMLTSLADIYALTAGMAFALGNVLIRKAQSMPAMTKAAAVWWGVVVLALAWLVIGSEPLPQVESSFTYLYAALLGAVGMVFMTLAVQYGVTRMPVQRSAVILLFELIAGAVSAQLLTNEVVLMQEWLGGVLILFAGYIAAQREERDLND